jgi:hypothetical protein
MLDSTGTGTSSSSDTTATPSLTGPTLQLYRCAIGPMSARIRARKGYCSD